MFTPAKMLIMMGRWFKNLISNGNFANGTTGFTTSGGTISAANNILTATGNGSLNNSNVNGSTTINCVTGDKIYITATVKVTNNVCQNLYLRLVGSSGGTTLTPKVITSPVQDQVYSGADFSGIVTITDQTGTLAPYIRHSYVDAATENGKSAEIQNFITVNLTALGLTDKDLAWCNANIPQIIIW
jgi:hypothetical protein